MQIYNRSVKLELLGGSILIDYTDISCYLCSITRITHLNNVFLKKLHYWLILSQHRNIVDE